MTQPHQRSYADRDLLVGVVVVAAFLGVSPQRVRQLVKEGLPRASRGSYPLKGCIQWYVAYWESRAGQWRSHRNEKQFFETELLKLRYEEATAHLISRDECISAVSAEFKRLSEWSDNLVFCVAAELEFDSKQEQAFGTRVDEAMSEFARDVAEYLSPDAKRWHEQRMALDRETRK